MLMPVHRDERGCACEGRRDVFAADDLYRAAPAPDHAHQRQKNGRPHSIQPQAPCRQAAPGAGLLRIDAVGESTLLAFFLHSSYCREAPRRAQSLSYNAAMHTIAIPPGPTEGFDLGGSDESLARLQDYFARFGDVYRVFAPSRGVFNYVINHPDDIKRVLLTNHRNYTKGEGIDRVKILLGNGIMTSEGAFWRRQRRMMQPSFHRRVIDQFSTLIGEANEKYAKRWAEQSARGEPVNISLDTSEMTLEIVLKSIFGSDLERLAQQMGVNPFEVVAKHSNRDLKFAFQFRSLGKLVGELINQRRDAPEKHFDFLSMFMMTRDRETDAPMADKALIDEVLTLIVAGHETTAAA